MILSDIILQRLRSLSARTFMWKLDNVEPSREKPRPAKALVDRQRKSLSVITKKESDLLGGAGSRPAAVEQLPQAAIPAMTAWHPFFLEHLDDVIEIFRSGPRPDDSL